jgi:hypothetical protein
MPSGRRSEHVSEEPLDTRNLEIIKECTVERPEVGPASEKTSEVRFIMQVDNLTSPEPVQ